MPVILTYPTTALYCPRQVIVGLQDNVRSTGRSEETGTIQFSERPGDKWIWTLEWPAQPNWQRRFLASMLNRGRGRVNTWSMFFFDQPLPRAPMGGTPQLASTVNAGANLLPITGATAGLSFSQADWISVGGMLRQIVAATESQVEITPRLNRQVTSGTPIVWSFARGEFRLMSNRIDIPFEPGICPAFSAQFEEVV